MAPANLDIATPTPGLQEILPNLLLDKTALAYKHEALRAYVATLDHHRFLDTTYLQAVKTHMDLHMLSFWSRLDVSITVSPGRMSGTSRRAAGARERVLEFYHSVPEHHGSFCEVVGQGSNLKPWVVQCGSSVGENGVKKVARMIAIVRRFIDPDFDPDGDSPLPATGLPNRSWKRGSSVASTEVLDIYRACKVQRR